jgi:hypothetical protein
MNPILRKGYTTGAAVLASRIVKMGSADFTVIQATDGAAGLLGATVEHVNPPSGGQITVTRLGLEYVELGGTVTRGQYVTSDANGKGIAAVIVAGTPLHVLGIAEESGVAGDKILVMIHPTVIANDTGIATGDVTVSSAELLALNATPKTLVAAPGAGKALILVDQQFFLDYASAAYAGIAAGEDLATKYTNAAGIILAQIEATGLLDQTTDQFRHVYPLADAQKTPAENAALVLHMLTGEVITGNSPLRVRTRYRTVDLAF